MVTLGHVKTMTTGHVHVRLTCMGAEREGVPSLQIRRHMEKTSKVNEAPKQKELAGKSAHISIYKLNITEPCKGNTSGTKPSETML